MPGTHSPATANSPETWTGPRAEAEPRADELGYPVVVDGTVCKTKAEAVKRIAAGRATVVISRLGPEAPAQEAPETKPKGTKQETKDGPKEGRPGS